MYQPIKPTAIPHTSRQRLTSKDGVVLERQYLFMPAEHWEMLQRLCYAQERSGSLVIQNLISIAAMGIQKDNTNDKSNSRQN